MRDAGHGRLGVVSSVGGLIAVPRLVPYSVAKFGAVGLAEGLYAELAGTGVTVTAVTPGLMRTGGHVRARFVDDDRADYAWFAPAASLPGLSISAGRAARRIVDGVLAGRPTVELTPLTVVARRVHGLAPATHRASPGCGQPGAARSVAARRRSRVARHARRRGMGCAEPAGVPRRGRPQCPR